MTSAVRRLVHRPFGKLVADGAISAEPRGGRISGRRRKSAWLALSLVAAGPSEQPVGAQGTAPAPVEIGQSYELTAAANGRRYRIDIYVPAVSPPPGGFPIVYHLDGNLHFPVVAGINRLRAWSNDMPHAVVVGIGYASADFNEVVRARWSDLSLPAPPQVLHSNLRRLQPELGGLDRFLDFVILELKPFVESRAPLNRACQTFMGHSMGGLAVLRALFRRPGSFQAYAALSPSIWWNQRAVLADEQAFVARARAGQDRARLLLTAGSLEEHVGEWRERSPEIARRIVENRQVRNAAELARRLRRQDPRRIEVQWRLFDGETHQSAIPASLNLGLRFGLECPAR